MSSETRCFARFKRADIAGIRALAIHAKDDEARAFYEHFDFVPSTSDPYRLFGPLKDLRKLLKS